MLILVILAKARIQSTFGGMDAGFHRHDEVLLGFTKSGQDLHFCSSVYIAQIIESCN